MSFKLIGNHEMEGKLRRGADGYARAEFGSAAVSVFKNMLLPVVVAETPVETGALRSTEHVEGPEIRGNQIDVSIVAGGPVAPYGPWVHEDPDAYHPVGDWKFIERPLSEWSPFIGGHIAKRINLGKVVR